MNCDLECPLSSAEVDDDEACTGALRTAHTTASMTPVRDVAVDPTSNAPGFQQQLMD